MKQALLVIDVQSGLFDLPPFPDDKDLVLERINQLMERARAAGQPVILIQQHSREGVLSRDHPGFQLAAGLRPADSDLRLVKTTPDSFLRTELAELLQRHGVERLVICGFASEACVDTTTRSALARGMPVTLVADAHTTRDKPHAAASAIRIHHTATLCGLKNFGTPIEARSADDIIF